MFVISNIRTLAEPYNVHAAPFSYGSAWAGWHFLKSRQSCKELVRFAVHKLKAYSISCQTGKKISNIRKSETHYQAKERMEDRQTS